MHVLKAFKAYQVILTCFSGLFQGCIFVCDNTWLTGCLFNPLAHGVDLVVESMTKYVSAGRCIGGHVLGPNVLVAPILSWIKAFGVFVASDHCEIFLEGLQSLRARMEATSRCALAAARHLEAHPAVNRVMYPRLESHPSHYIARRYLELGPGCIWFHISAKKAKVQSLLASGPIEYKPLDTDAQVLLAKGLGS